MTQTWLLSKKMSPNTEPQPKKWAESESLHLYLSTMKTIFHDPFFASFGPLQFVRQVRHVKLCQMAILPSAPWVIGGKEQPKDPWCVIY